MQGSIKQRKELLYGLIDTDGSISIKKTGSRKFSFSTNSNSLVKDVRQLALSLGYGVTLQEYHRKEEIHKNVEYNVNIYTTENISKSNKHLQKLSTQTDWYESKKELYSKIIDIQKVEEREMTCFSVDNEEKLFLINDYIVTHNTTFIKEHGLENYALSPDTLRLQFGSPIYNEQGRLAITQDKDKQVWDTLFEILENRMQNGEFTVIDATHSTGKLIKRYEKLVKKYGYRAYVVTLEQDLDTLLQRNEQREPLKQVPVPVIENIYERLQHEHIPSYAVAVEPDKLMETIRWDKDFVETGHYNKVHVIGDIHSCFTALNEFVSYEYIADHQDEFFIFVGDYFDRGIEPKETFDYLEMIYNLDNVALLEGIMKDIYVSMLT
ncbi:RNA ligase [Staphylococcus phage Alsa_3]|nr:RNA ligase [Staphylococcus phage Alsa_3]